MKATIVLSGCDDSTEADIELTATQFAWLEEVFERVNEHSTYGCEPRASIRRRAD